MVEAKGGAGSATLSMAYAGFRYVRWLTFIAIKELTLIFSFAESVIKATKGESGIVEPTYIYLPGVSGGDEIAKETGVDYFSVPVELGVCLRKPSTRDSLANVFPAIWR